MVYMNTLKKDFMEFTPYRYNLFAIRCDMANTNLGDFVASIGS